MAPFPPGVPNKSTNIAVFQPVLQHHLDQLVSFSRRSKGVARQFEGGSAAKLPGRPHGQGLPQRPAGDRNRQPQRRAKRLVVAETPRKAWEAWGFGKLGYGWSKNMGCL